MTKEERVVWATALGMLEGMADTILTQLSLKFGPLAPEIEKRVRSGSSKKLYLWAERVLSANTLDEVFG